MIPVGKLSWRNSPNSSANYNKIYYLEYVIERQWENIWITHFCNINNVVIKKEMNAAEFSISLNSALPKDSGWLQFALTLYIMELREKIFGVNIDYFHWK